MKKANYFFFFFTFCFQQNVLAQFRYDSLRQGQLMHDTTTEFSLFSSFSLGNVETFSSISKKAGLVSLPAKIGFQMNSSRPFGFNNAGYTLSSGFQAMATAGFHAKFYFFDLQFRPEVYWASNASYTTTSGFGTHETPLSKFYGGQSALSLNVVGQALGFSTQNLWWGPGQFSALMLSNNAPGFPHISLNSKKPIKTSIGHFEYQVIWANLSEDSTKPAENFFNKPGFFKNESRFLNGIVVTYQPKFLPGIFLGVTRMAQLYVNDQQRTTGFINKWIPVFAPSSPTDNANTTSIPSDGAFSFFTRWLFPQYHFEVYGEYGYNDFKENLRDAADNTNHSSAFILGFKKLFKIQKNNFWDFSGEITQMAQTPSYIIRNAGNWSEHSQVAAGMTHQNQILGPGPLKGSNVQTLQLRQKKGANQWGLKLQRIQQDPKGLTTRSGTAPNLGMRPYQWNDIVLGFLGQKKLSLNKTGSMVLNGEVNFVFAKNYGWEKGNKFNLFTSLHATYFF